MNQFDFKSLEIPKAFLILLTFIIVLIFIKINKSNYETFQTFTDNDVVLFYTDWCKFSNLFLDVWNDTIGYFSHYKFYKIDCDKNKDMASQYDIRKLPTVYLFKNNTKIKYEGEINRKQFLSFLRTGKNKVNNCDENNENCN